MKTVGIGLIALAIVFFFVFYFIMAPMLSSMIPDGESHYYLVLLVNLLVGWGLGVVVPVAMGVIGVMFIREGREDALE